MESEDRRGRQETVVLTPSEYVENLETTEDPDHRVLQDYLDSTGKREVVETPDQWDQVAILERPARKVYRVNGRKDLRVKRVNKVHQETLVFQDNPPPFSKLPRQMNCAENQDPKVTRAISEKREKLEIVAWTDNLDYRAILVSKEKRETLESTAHGEKEESLDPMETWEIRGKKESPDSLDKMDLLESRGSPVLLEDQEAQANKDHRDHQAR